MGHRTNCCRYCRRLEGYSTIRHMELSLWDVLLKSIALIQSYKKSPLIPWSPPFLCHFYLFVGGDDFRCWMKIRFRRFGCLLVMSRISLQQSLNLAAHPMMFPKENSAPKKIGTHQKRWDLSDLRFMNINILLTGLVPNNNIWTPTETIVLIQAFMISFLGFLHQLFWFVSTNKWNVNPKKKQEMKRNNCAEVMTSSKSLYLRSFLHGKRKIDDDRFSWVYWRSAVLTRHHHNPYRKQKEKKKDSKTLSSRNWTTFPSCTFVANPDMLIKGRCLRGKSSACRKKIRSKASSI